ncbi:MAG: cellulase family glycosylhydrolase [Bacteroidales bacterium]|nr:cellulase family glycosylhydrolase [Bacteroidales bacterium]
MKSFSPLNFYSAVFILLFSLFTVSLSAQTPVAVHGQLSISGNRLKDKNGNNYQLRGMSMFWSNWQGKFWNYETIKWLRDDWNCNVVRAAMGISTDDKSGYLDKPELEKQKMITVIEAAIDLGIYVIVDWHSHSAQNETAQATAFFAEISKKYGSYPNIIYETYNEPVTDWGTIKNYHNTVVSEIRKNDTKNVIILGTAFYSQNVEEAVNSPVSGSNLCYALHYYAASHSFWGAMENASSKGYYVFVSEFGTCSSSGDGNIDVGNSNTWWSKMDAIGVSWCNWAVSDVDEAAAIVKPGSSIGGGWTSSDLTPNGVLVRDKLRSYAKDPVPTNIAPYITSSPKSQSVPINSSTTFTVEAVGSGPITYKWYFGNTLISGATGNVLTLNNITEENVGSYYCELTNSVGTTKSKTVTLDVRYRSTFYGKSQVLPGVIQFEDFDKGGQNIGYFDASYGNSGGGYRPDEDVDIEPIQGRANEFAVGFTDKGEWLAYSVNVGWDGEYTIDVYYASLPGGGAYSMYMGDKQIAPLTTVPTSGGWFTYGKNTVTTQLTKGENIFKFKIEASGFNIDYLEFKSTTPPEIAPIISINPKNSTAKIGTSTSFFVSATGAQPLSYQWYFNDVIITGATKSTLDLTSVDIDSEGSYHVVVTNHLGTATSTKATLSITTTSAYQGIPAVIPGIVLCKNFDEGGNGVAYNDLTDGNEAQGTQHNFRDEDVDTEACTDGNSGHSIGYIDGNEWLEYSVQVKFSGTYTVGFRLLLKVQWVLLV